jgi:hypothetical protein
LLTCKCAAASPKLIQRSPLSFIITLFHLLYVLDFKCYLVLY